MSCTNHALPSRWRFSLVRESFLQRPGLPFASLLGEDQIARACVAPDDATDDNPDATTVDSHVSDDRIYTPAVTLWAFLSQMLAAAAERSCRAAVARVAVLWLGLSREISASNTGAYCRARAKLHEPAIARLSRDVAEACEHAVPERWLWKIRHVYLVDGATISMPDTLPNQQVYPQPTSQQPGVGFPLLRIVAIFSLATGMVRDLACGPYAGKETGETALLRELLKHFSPGDVLVGDRYYIGWFMLALLQQAQIDFVVRQHQRRETDFRRGERLGVGDHVVEWPRPPRPEWMDEATYAAMPATLQVREVQVPVSEPGFRVETLVVVTSLLDAESHTAEEIGQLYRRRWLAELDLRVLKSTLQLDVLRCQTPEMVRKELRTGVLAYNLIRQAMLDAAFVADCSPRELSFTAALQTILASWSVAVLCPELRASLSEQCLRHLASHRVGDRPNRIEPRAVKRRPKPHALLTEPRAKVRQKLLKSKTT